MKDVKISKDAQQDIDKYCTFFEGCHVEDIASDTFQKHKNSIAVNSKAKKTRTNVQHPWTNMIEVNRTTQDPPALFATNIVTMIIIILITIAMIAMNDILALEIHSND